MFGGKRYHHLTAILALFAMLLIIIVPQINRLTLKAQSSYLASNHHPHHLHQQQNNQNLNAVERAKLAVAQITAKKAAAKNAHNHLHHFGEHHYLCEYCVLAAHIVPAICLLLLLLAFIFCCKKIALQNFALIAFYFYISHPPRAGPHFIA